MKQKRTQIQITCPQCQIFYSKDLSEYKRNERLERTSYCSISCRSKANPPQTLPENRYDIKDHRGNKRDKFTPYRYILHCTKNSNRKQSSIKVEDVKNQWDKQNGLCIYTGLPMFLPEYNTGKTSPFKTASIDRIDSSLPYTKDNIQIILRAINFLKSSESHEDTVAFLDSMVENMGFEPMSCSTTST